MDQSRPDVLFRSPTGQEVDRVDGTTLPQTVHTPDALLEARGVPRQLEVDDQSATMVKIQAFASCVSRQQDSRCAFRESCPGSNPVHFVEAAMNDRKTVGGTNRIGNVQQGVAIFRKNDDGFLHTLKEAGEYPYLAADRNGIGCQLDLLENRQLSRKLIVVIILGKWKQELGA